jgi:hypothetical protein
MAPAMKADLITALPRAAYELALAGIRHRYPDASPREQALRMAILTCGPDLARDVYPEVAWLDSRDRSG